jgi:hypothetical protein
MSSPSALDGCPDAQRRSSAAEGNVAPMVRTPFWIALSAVSVAGFLYLLLRQGSEEPAVASRRAAAEKTTWSPSDQALVDGYLGT